MKKGTGYKIGLITIGIVFLIMIAGGTAYQVWNTSDPQKTCNNCHEISPSYNTWAASAHRNFKCENCHGTALSNGWHSLKEKTNMVFSHFSGSMIHEDIGLDEAQILETMERCRVCHQTEYFMWNSSGHSASYADLFLNEVHNTTEQLNFDCLRCHGMFYEGTINDLVEPLSMQGPWSLLDPHKSDQPTIPCMTCHKVHSEGQPSQAPDHSSPDSIFYTRVKENKTVGFYSRHEEVHFALDQLPTPVILHGSDTIKTPDDPVYRLCVQCHAPSVWHQAGSHDDHTPIGVHEGISCATCHEKHSNFQGNSCDKCHPAISNCKLDVKAMNTSYFSASSTNNIHFVACVDCHEEGHVIANSRHP